MGNRFLFGAIALLMAAIVGVGFFAIMDTTGNAQTDADAQTTIVSTSASTSIPTSGSTNATSPISGPVAGTYTMAQVAQHASSASCYTAINGSVYDLTAFINQHPGGAQAILSLCGVDGTAAFMAQHGGEGRPESELASFKIGTLSNSTSN